MTKKIRVLSIDGGGIKGVVPGQVVVYIENKIQELTNNPSARISDYFDMFAGTSTGGILTCAYLIPDEKGNRPKYSAKEVVDLYLENGDDIFRASFFQKIKSVGGVTDEKYPSEGIDGALNDYLADVKLSELLKPCLVTAYDMKRRKGHFFTQHNAHRPENDFYVRDVARATSAAPTYFECAHIKSMTNVTYPMVDGGLFANNPAMCAYAEVRETGLTKTGKPKNKLTAKDMSVLSLGTGFAKEYYTFEDVKNWGMVQWVKPLIDVMMSGVAETVDYQMKQIYDAIDCPDQYLRVNMPLASDVSAKMDDASRENLLALSSHGTDVAQQFQKELDHFIETQLLN